LNVLESYPVITGLFTGTGILHGGAVAAGVIGVVDAVPNNGRGPREGKGTGNRESSDSRSEKIGIFCPKRDSDVEQKDVPEQHEPQTPFESLSLNGAVVAIWGTGMKGNGGSDPWY